MTQSRPPYRTERNATFVTFLGKNLKGVEMSSVFCNSACRSMKIQRRLSTFHRQSETNASFLQDAEQLFPDGEDRSNIRNDENRIHGINIEPRLKSGCLL